MSAAAPSEFDVGGVRLPRPFRIRRLGHFGLNVADVEAARRFYCGLLGFRVSDRLDFGPRMDAATRAGIAQTAGYFTRHGTDHHSFVLFPRKAVETVNPGAYRDHPEVTVNQITWQVGSLHEVVNGYQWFTGRGRPVHRAGRDLPGSNWHFYPPDPDGHTNELYYGIEQIGWDGLSKPDALHKIRYREPPALPHESEYREVMGALGERIDLAAGVRQADDGGEERHDVGGVLLARPFKIVRIGPVRLFVDDVERAAAFYRDDLGLSLTEEVTWQGHRAVFLRANTEHHSLALYPKPLRAALGLAPDRSLMSFGVQVGTYRQLRDALGFLAKNGVTIRHLPPELFPGIDYTAFAIDPDGHAIQLYYYMEQIGWDGKPRPAHLRPAIDNARWPETVAGVSDSFLGENLLGPLG